jgi:hypothetical protein
VTARPEADMCPIVECWSNATCESVCHDPLAKCTAGHRCLVP